MEILSAIQTIEVRKSIPYFDPKDTLRISLHGDTVKCFNWANLFALRLPPFNRDSAIALLTNSPYIMIAKKSASKNLLTERNFYYNIGKW